MAYGLLKGKKGIIFGALNDMSIAWKVAERAHEEGAEFTLSNTPVALRLGNVPELAEKTGAEVIEADATNLKDVENVLATIERGDSLDGKEVVKAMMVPDLNKKS